MKHFYTFRNQDLHNNATVKINGNTITLSKVAEFSEDESSDYSAEYAVAQSILVDNVSVTGTWLDSTSGPKKKSE